MMSAFTTHQPATGAHEGTGYGVDQLSWNIASAHNFGVCGFMNALNSK